MVSRVSTNSMEVPQRIGEFLLRRQLLSEIAGIVEDIDKSGANDETTKLLRSWTENFSMALRNTEDENEVLKKFVGFLQEILTDPISQATLDKKAVLGTDDITYGSLSLCVYYSTVSEEHKHRSPLEPNNPKPFTTKPHPLVPLLINWLERRGEVIQSREYLEKYEQLKRENKLSTLPTVQTLWKQKIAARNTSMKEELTKEGEEFAKQLRADKPSEQELQKISASLDQKRNHLMQELQDFRNQMQNRFNALGRDVLQLNRAAQNLVERDQRLQEQIQRIENGFAELAKEQNEFELLSSKGNAEGKLKAVQRQVADTARAFFQNFDVLQNEFRQQIQQLIGIVNHLEQGVQNLEQGNQALRNQTQGVGRALSETEKREAKLQIAINEMDKAIKKRKSGFFKSLGVTVGLIGVSIFASWALTSVLASHGVSSAGVSLTQQGAAGTLTVAF